MTFTSLANQLLIAMPSLTDENFARTVSLLCQHDENGSMGVVLNRPIQDFALPDVLAHLDIKINSELVHQRTAVYSGGPVHPELGMVLHRDRGEWESTLPVGEEFGLTTSMDIMQAIAQGNGPGQSLFILGYAGWSAGQLEYEIQENAWLHTDATPALVFETPVAERWQQAASQLGVDLNLLSSQAGHA